MHESQRNAELPIKNDCSCCNQQRVFCVSHAITELTAVKDERLQPKRRRIASKRGSRSGRVALQGQGSASLFDETTECMHTSTEICVSCNAA